MSVKCARSEGHVFRVIFKVFPDNTLNDRSVLGCGRQYRARVGTLGVLYSTSDNGRPHLETASALSSELVQWCQVCAGKVTDGKRDAGSSVR